MSVLSQISKTAAGKASPLAFKAPTPRIRLLFKRLNRLAKTLSEAGTQGYPPDTRRRLVVMNLVAYLIGFTTLGYAFQHSLLSYDKYQPVILLNLALVLTAFAVPFSHRFGDMCGGLIIIISEYCALITFTYYLGRDAGVHLQYFIAAAAAIVVFGTKRWWLTLPAVAIGIGLHLLAWFNFPQHSAIINAPPEVTDGIYAQAAISTGVLTAAAVYYAITLAEHAKAETDALLRNILPDSIVERLKSEGSDVVADSFDEASILFADITGFVALARKLGAEKTVELLNNLVMRFDVLAAKHGVEKIKTIGDAYMVASGIPEPQEDHTQRLARMGLDMLAAVKDVRIETGLDLNVRVGLAAGPVMAGVIGTRKFSYDVWGDPVNMAARLESMSEPGKILICPGCFEKLSPEFQFELHGEIDIKGVGLQKAWFVIAENKGP